MVNKLDNWYIKVHGYNKNHPVIKYLNNTYRKDHDGSAKYYGVNNGDSFYCNRNNEITAKITELTLNEFEIMFLNKKPLIYELW